MLTSAQSRVQVLLMNADPIRFYERRAELVAAIPGLVGELAQELHRTTPRTRVFTPEVAELLEQGGDISVIDEIVNPGDGPIQAPALPSLEVEPVDMQEACYICMQPLMTDQPLSKPKGCMHVFHHACAVSDRGVIRLTECGVCRM